MAHRGHVLEAEGTVLQRSTAQLSVSTTAGLAGLNVSFPACCAHQLHKELLRAISVRPLAAVEDTGRQHCVSADADAVSSIATAAIVQRTAAPLQDSCRSPKMLPSAC